MNDNFNYKNNILCLNDKSVLSFIKNTPVHLYDSSFIKQQYQILNNSIKTTDKLICYALKANFNKKIAQIIINLGGGIDCVSIGEIKHVLSLGCDPKKIVFSGVGKTEEEIIFAIKKNIKQISSESEEEVNEIIEISEKLKIKANICLRVNLDVEVSTHKYISTGSKSSKFGIEHSKIMSICEKIKSSKFVNFIGLSTHIGSQILDYKNFEIAFNNFIKVIKSIQNASHIIKSVSIGGGLGIAYRPTEIEQSIFATTKYLQIVNDFVKQIDMTIILEPGRFLVGNSCITIAKVVRIKKTLDTEFLILNVGMNNIIRPSLYQAYHHILPIVKNENLSKINYKIVGPVCESADIFHEQYQMQTMQKGDYVAIFSTGAYCSSMASNYNLMPIAEEIFI